MNGIFMGSCEKKAGSKQRKRGFKGREYGILITGINDLCPQIYFETKVETHLVPCPACRRKSP